MGTSQWGVQWPAEPARVAVDVDVLDLSFFEFDGEITPG